jgi:hypothetical protein
VTDFCSSGAAPQLLVWSQGAVLLLPHAAAAAAAPFMLPLLLLMLPLLLLLLLLLLPRQDVSYIALPAVRFD